MTAKLGGEKHANLVKADTGLIEGCLVAYVELEVSATKAQKDKTLSAKILDDFEAERGRLNSAFGTYKPLLKDGKPHTDMQDVVDRFVAADGGHEGNDRGDARRPDRDVAAAIGAAGGSADGAAVAGGGATSRPCAALSCHFPPLPLGERGPGVRGELAQGAASSVFRRQSKYGLRSDIPSILPADTRESVSLSENSQTTYTLRWGGCERRIAPV